MYLYLEDSHSRKCVWYVVCEMSAILSRAQLNSLVSWGQPAAYALVTSMSNPCGNYKVVVISRAWVHPGSQGNMPSGVQWRKPPTQCPNFVDTWPIFTIESSHPNNIFFQKITIQVAKSLQIFFWFSWRYYGSHFMTGCSYWLCKAKNKHNSLWSDQTRQGTEQKFQTTPLLVNQGDLQRLQRCRLQ